MASSSCCLRMMGLGLERRWRRPNKPVLSRETGRRGRLVRRRTPKPPPGEAELPRRASSDTETAKGVQNALKQDRVTQCHTRATELLEVSKSCSRGTRQGPPTSLLLLCLHITHTRCEAKQLPSLELSLVPSGRSRQGLVWVFLVSVTPPKNTHYLLQQSHFPSRGSRPHLWMRHQLQANGMLRFGGIQNKH